MFDLSTYGKFLVQGRDATTVLQRVCANDVDVEEGRIVYTQWLNEFGGIEAGRARAPGAHRAGVGAARPGLAAQGDP